MTSSLVCHPHAPRFACRLSSERSALLLRPGAVTVLAALGATRRSTEPGAAAPLETWQRTKWRPLAWRGAAAS